jgi:glutaredoxin-like protein NrdH
LTAERRVKLYTLSTCSHCKAVKKLLTDLGIPYEYTDIDLVPRAERESILAEVRKLNPSVSFPTIIIGETIIVGNREDKIREALGLP